MKEHYESSHTKDWQMAGERYKDATVRVGMALGLAGICVMALAALYLIRTLAMPEIMARVGSALGGF